MEHKHHGKSSAKFLDADEILTELDLKGDETFMDAGCGDGYISLKAIEKYLPNGTVYAVDLFEDSIKSLDDYKNENNIENLINIEADITKVIPGVDDGAVDVVLMVNVFHGFKSPQDDDVVRELKRVTDENGRIAILDFNPISIPHGPPVDIKISPGNLEDLFNNHNLKKIYLNENMGVDYPEGNSHYLIVFEKE